MRVTVRRPRSHVIWRNRSRGMRQRRGGIAFLGLLGGRHAVWDQTVILCLEMGHGDGRLGSRWRCETALGYVSQVKAMASPRTPSLSEPAFRNPSRLVSNDGRLAWVVESNKMVLDPGGVGLGEPRQYTGDEPDVLLGQETSDFGVVGSGRDPPNRLDKRLPCRLTSAPDPQTESRSQGWPRGVSSLRPR